jgi:hypothetical protein
MEPTRALRVMEEEPPGRHELKAQFVGLRAEKSKV